MMKAGKGGLMEAGAYRGGLVEGGAYRGRG